jgi:uncharacterized membrane protein (DUF2068 family)
VSVVIAGIDAGNPRNIISEQGRLNIIPYLWNPNTLAYEVQQISAGVGSNVVVTNTVPVTVATLPLPSGAALEAGGNLATIAGKDFATQTTLALIKAKTDNLDVLLSTRTKPADAQSVVGTFWQATQPVSAAALPLPTGAATEATLGAVAKDATLTTIDTDIKATQPRDVTDRAGRALGVITAANLDAALSTRATESTLAGVAKDSTLGTVAATPAAYSVLDRLYQLGLKLDKSNALLALNSPKALLPKLQPTLLHR